MAIGDGLSGLAHSRHSLEMATLSGLGGFLARLKLPLRISTTQASPEKKTRRVATRRVGMPFDFALW